MNGFQKKQNNQYAHYTYFLYRKVDTDIFLNLKCTPGFYVGEEFIPASIDPMQTRETQHVVVKETNLICL